MGARAALTIFPILAWPDAFLFLHTDATTATAENFTFSLNDDAKPGRLANDRLVVISRLLMEGLARLQSRDLIDVKLFAWVTECLWWPELGSVTQEETRWRRKGNRNEDPHGIGSWAHGSDDRRV